MKGYFSNFSLERKELLKEKEPKESKGTRRVKIVLCHVNRKVKGVGRTEMKEKLNGGEEAAVCGVDVADLGELRQCCEASLRASSDLEDAIFFR